VASSDDASPKPTLVERMRAQREIHAMRPLYLRVLITAAGFTLLFTGLAMLVLPGPALAGIPIALAILSLEFAWAGRALETALVKAEQAKQSAKETSRTQRIVVGVAVGLAAIAAVVASILWEVPVVPYT
jgi:Putative transmembrane protein (PGPGW)